MVAPFLLDHPAVASMFPRDAIERARKLNGMFGGAVGAYTDSRGAAGVRQEVADFIAARDGHPSNPDHIFLTGGRARAFDRVRHACTAPWAGHPPCSESGKVDRRFHAAAVIPGT